MVGVDDYRALISGYTWYQKDTVGKPVILTYSFETAAPEYFVQSHARAAESFSPFSDFEKSVVRAALQQWSDNSGVQFFETTRHQGDLSFGFYNLDLLGSPEAAGLAAFPSSFAYTSGGRTSLFSGDLPAAGDIQFDTTYRTSPHFLSDFPHVAVHEIGHALGLKHSFEGTAGHQEVLTAEADKGSNTVMSYDQTTRMAQLGPLDIAAAQYLYGPASSKGTQFTRWDYDGTAERLVAHGSAAGEMLRGTGADDVIYTEGGRDTVYTAQGNDVIVATGQNLGVNGGSGRDTVFTGLDLSSLDQLRGSGDVRYITSNGASQIYTGVERLVFNNDMIALDVQGNAGQVYRLYKASFDRIPDVSGLSSHVNAVDHGLSLHDDAASFLASPEFVQRSGSALSDQAFVTALYRNVLQRTPDDAGLATWTTALAANTLDRAGVLVSFSESTENHMRVDPTIAAGIHLDYGVFA